MTRPRQTKPENVTTQSLKKDSFGNRVVKEALALSSTTSSTKNDDYMVNISNTGRNVTEETTVLPEDRSKRHSDETNSELPEVELGETAVTNIGRYGLI